MTRRSFFSMFTAAVAGVVVGITVRSYFRMIYYGGFKSKNDPFGEWPVYGRDELNYYIRRQPRKYYLMKRDFEPPMSL